jgi:TM2 domain-containing membrane protein YozV
MTGSAALIDLKRTLDPAELAIVSTEMARRRKSVGVAYFLLVCLGWTGAHKFYLGRTREGIAYLGGPILLGIGLLANNTSMMAPAAVLSLLCGILALVDLFTLPRQTLDANTVLEESIILAVHP